MQTHRKKKIEIIVEKARVRSVLERVEALGAKGYTMIPDVSGRGHHGDWGHSDILDVYRSVLVIVIADADIAQRIVDESQQILQHATGIIYVSDVDVVRSEHF